MKSFSLSFAAVALLALVSASCTVHKAEPTGLTGPSTAVLPPSAGQISAPVAQFVFGPAAPATNSPVQFDASSTCASGVTASGACNATSNTVVSYAWDFGDGGSATGRTASHTYTIARTYSVTLTVTNSIGLSTASTKLLTIIAGVAPTATFVLSPTTVGVGSSVNVDASQSRAASGHTIASYTWNWGDGGISSHPNPQDGHSYSAAGTYIVMLTVTDDAGTQGAAVQSVTVSASAVTAAFVFSPTAPIVGTTINFDASVSKAAPGRSLIQYNWNWGDGSVATTTGSPLTTHTYGSVGTYNVTLTVTDDSGSSATAVQAVTALPVGSPVPPTAAFVVSPTSPVAGSAAFFDATASKAAAGHTISSYSWNWGDGSPAGVDEKPTHTFAAAASYTVTLTVRDDANVAGVVSQVITVSSVAAAAPTAAFTSSPSGASVNQVINFNATASKAAAGHSITNYSWNWGNGSLGSGVTTTFTYTLAGTYTVTLTVTDDAGLTNTVSQSITVGVNPTAKFTSSPSSPGVSQTVFFDATSSSAAPGFSIVGYAWNFGDGSTSSSGPTTSHPYSAVGTYTVTLTVTDNAGAGQKGTTSNTVVVGGAPVAKFVISTITGAPLVANFNASQSTASAGHTLVSYAWNFGDNTTATGVTTSHPYALPGTYNVVLTVTDDVGQIGTATGTITVTAVTVPPPTADFGASTSGLNVTVNGNLSHAASGHTITTYAWDFGDSTTGSGALPPTKAYGAAGTYSIVLTVTDDVGQTATTSKSVTVN